MKNTIFLLLLLASCSHEPETTPLSCTEQFLLDNQLVAYTGQDIGCNLYVALFELDGKDYFYTDCHCADMLSIPVDCDGQPLCQSFKDPLMTYFFQNGVYKGIVGYKP